MTTTAQITPRRTPSGPEQPTGPDRGAHAPAPERRTFGDALAEILPLVDFIPGYGPPIVFLLGPWLLLVLLLAGPFALLFTFVVVAIVAATVLAALIAAIVAAPYLLVRHLRRHESRRPSISAPAARPVAIGSPRVAA